MIKTYPRFLWLLTMAYTAFILLANWFDVRLVQLGGLITDAGTIIFPLTFLVSDLITEVYGYKNARRAIWCGFAFNAVFIIYGQLVTHLPSPAFATSNHSFDQLFQLNIRIIIASTISYFISEPTNSFVLAKLKLICRGNYLAARLVSSTFCSSGLDSFIFGSLAFYGVIPNTALLNMILTMWFIKVMVEILGLPLSLWLVKKLKRLERLDIYDIATNYNLFVFDSKYQEDANRYQRPKP